MLSSSTTRCVCQPLLVQTAMMSSHRPSLLRTTTNLAPTGRSHTLARTAFSFRSNASPRVQRVALDVCSPNDVSSAAGLHRCRDAKGSLTPSDVRPGQYANSVGRFVAELLTYTLSICQARHHKLIVSVLCIDHDFGLQLSHHTISTHSMLELRQV